jgi:hypothetical protein
MRRLRRLLTVAAFLAAVWTYRNRKLDAHERARGYGPGQTKP